MHGSTRHSEGRYNYDDFVSARLRERRSRLPFRVHDAREYCIARFGKVMKAEWRKRDFKENPHPPEQDYELFEELALPDGVIATIEQFKANPNCFYANTAEERSGCLRSHEWSRQWCEIKTKNRPN